MNIVVGADYYLKTLWNVLAKQLPTAWQVHYADSMEEAHASVRENRG
jgi:hypothetical protein